MRLTAADHAQVTGAVAEAERRTDGEIVTIVARRSDEYRDVALHWAVLAMLLALALPAVWPGVAERLATLAGDEWSMPTTSALFTAALVLVSLAFLVVRVALGWAALRLVLTPGATKARRVRRRALALFRTAAEQRTVARTGVLLYLSLDEHRAEIIADAAIHGRVAPDVWGAAMAALVTELRSGRPAEGMAAAVKQIGVVLAEHFPKTEGDANELPDRLIEL